MRRLAVAVSVVAMLAGSSIAWGIPTLSGTYRTTVTSHALGGLVKGSWTVTFNRGVFTAAKGGIVATNGSYSISGSKVTVRSARGQSRCPIASVYRYALNGSRLKFTLISGSSTNPSCEARQIVLAGSLTKAG